MAWVAIAVAVVMFVLAVVRGLWNLALIGLALAVPAAWHFYASRHDRREHAFYEASVRAFRVTGGDMSLIAQPRYLQRRWVPLLLGCAVVAGTGVGLGVEAPQSTGIYANCDAAFEDGRANIPRNDEAYDRALDRDSDGIACEAD